MRKAGEVPLRGFVAKVDIPAVGNNYVGVVAGVSEEGPGEVKGLQDLLRH